MALRHPGAIQGLPSIHPKNRRLVHTRNPHFSPQLALPSRSYASSKKRIAIAMANPPGNDDKNDNDKPPPSPAEQRKQRELNLLLSLIVQYPAVRGSIAVAAGYFLHIDPLGTLRFNSHDAFIGIIIALLPSILDACILLPNWEPQLTTRTMKLKLPKSVAERLQQLEPLTTTFLSGDGDGAGDDNNDTSSVVSSSNGVVEEQVNNSVNTNNTNTDAETNESDSFIEVERVMTVRADQPPLRDALQTIQSNRIVSNLGRALSAPAEGFLLILVHIAEEMLYRGIMLVAVSRWITENLYYAGVEESVAVWPGGVVLAPPQVGAVVGAVGLTVGAVGLLVQRELFPLKMLKIAKKQLDGMQKKAKKKEKEGVKEGEKEEENKGKKDVVVRILEQVRSGAVRQQRWIVAVEGMVELVQWSTLSTSFLLTGNILAPIAGSVANDIFYSAMQRVKQAEMRKSVAERAARSEEMIKQRADLLAAVRAHRTQQQLAQRSSSRSTDDGDDKDDTDEENNNNSNGSSGEKSAPPVSTPNAGDK